MPSNRRRWTEEEDRIIMRFPPQEAIKRINRSYYAIAERRQKIDAPRNKHHQLTESDVALIEELGPTQAALALGVSRGTVWNFMRRRNNAE